MASFRYGSVAMTETGLAREGGFGQRNLGRPGATIRGRDGELAIGLSGARKHPSPTHQP